MIYKCNKASSHLYGKHVEDNGNKIEHFMNKLKVTNKLNNCSIGKLGNNNN